jgi:hypothetical protein
MKAPHISLRTVNQQKSPQMPVAIPRPKPKPIFSSADILPELEMVLLASYVYRKNVANEENLPSRAQWATLTHGPGLIA